MTEVLAKITKIDKNMFTVRSKNKNHTIYGFSDIIKENDIIICEIVHDDRGYYLEPTGGFSTEEDWLEQESS